MKTSLVLGISLLLTTRTAPAQCSGLSKSQAQLQWSERATVVAPDHAWEIEVRPVLDADENRTPVVLHNCDGTPSRTLFILEREAELHWEADSRHVLVINESLSGTNKLLFFTVSGFFPGTKGPPPDYLDRTVKETLMGRLGEERHIQFYLPSFVAWKGDDLLLAVGGATYGTNVGPLDTYCYGMRINSLTLRVKGVLTEKELKASTGRSCSVSP